MEQEPPTENSAQESPATLGDVLYVRSKPPVEEREWASIVQSIATKGTVLAWIMNQTRSRAIDRLRFDNRKKRSRGSDEQTPSEPAADPHDILELRKQGESLRRALAVLTPDERQAIEATFFAGVTHVEAAKRLNQPLGTIKTRIRSGLHKMRHALIAETGDP